MAASIYYNPISHTYEYRSVDESVRVGIILTVNGLAALPPTTRYAWIPDENNPSQGSLYARDDQGNWALTDNATVLSLAWAGITGKPSSSPQAIDAAVQKAHEHINIAVLNKFSVVEGRLLYDGKQLNVDGSSIIFTFTGTDIVDGILTLQTGDQPISMLSDPDGVCYMIAPETLTDGMCTLNLAGMDIGDTDIWTAYV